MEGLEAEEEGVEDDQHYAQVLIEEEDRLQVMKQVSLNEIIEINHIMINVQVSSTRHAPA